MERREIIPKCFKSLTSGGEVFYLSAMDLEGSLNRFSVAEVFQLLSFSRKTGTLGLQRQEQHHRQNKSHCL